MSANKKAPSALAAVCGRWVAIYVETVFPKQSSRLGLRIDEHGKRHDGGRVRRHPRHGLRLSARSSSRNATLEEVTGRNEFKQLAASRHRSRRDA
jgi:hypothetical protein